MNTRIFRATLILALVFLVGFSCLAGTNFWFSSGSSSTQITSINAPAGSSFTFSIWYQTDTAWSLNALELMVGYDRATTEGILATPIDQEITAGAPTVANIGSIWPNVLANNIGGANGSGVRPFGVHLAIGTALGTQTTATTATKICDITLENSAIPVNGTYNVVLVNNPVSAAGWASFVVLGESLLGDSTSATLTVNSTQSQPLTTMAVAKQQGDNANVNFSGVVVAAFGGYFYIESTDRSCGIQVVSDYSASVGETIDVQGQMQTLSTGERCINASSLTPSSGSPILPLGLTNKALGGGNWSYNSGTGAGQVGVTGGTGANTIGLLVRVWGTITSAGGGYVVIDDGSGTPVIVNTTYVTGVPTSGYVSVTGVCSLGSSQGRLVIATRY